MGGQNLQGKNGSSSQIYVTIIGIICLIGALSVVAIVIMRPAQDNTLAIASILGFLTPIVSTILAIMIRGIHLDINSRVTELLDITKQASFAEGKLEGKELGR